jgi:4-amino-4-deoxy-L-arabinose transferase-like glycosyltransferase
MAKNFAESGKQTLQVAPGIFAAASYVTVGYPLTAPVGLSYKLFGHGVPQGRSVMVLFLLGFVVAAYFLTRKLFGKDIAMWTVLLLATFPMLYGNGKAVLGEVPALFFLVLTLITLFQLEKHAYRGWHRYVFVGLVAGLCAATKMFFVLFIFALFVTCLLNIRSIRLTWSGFAMGLLALVAPLALWVYFQFGTDASIQSVVSYYTNPYSVENIPLHMLQNAKRFITETTPFFTFVLMSFWGISLFIRRKKQRISSVEVSGFVFCILVILSYLRLEGWYRYLFPATIVSLIFLPNSLFSIYNFFKERFSLPGQVIFVLYGVLLLLVAGQLYESLFTSYVAQHYSSTRTATVENYLSTLGNTSVFLYNTPELAIMLPSKNYYQYLTPLPEITIGEESFAALEAGVPDIVIVTSELYTSSDPQFRAYRATRAVDRYTILEKK